MSVVKHDAREAERGRARRQRGAISWKLALTLLIIALTINAGAHYVPLAYNAKAFEEVMQQTVNQAPLLPSGNKDTAEVTKLQLQRLAAEYSLPDDVTINVKQIEGQRNVEATVEFVKSVQLLPFSLYDYDYEFSRTMRSKSLLN